MFLLALAPLFGSVFCGSIDPKFAQNITLFHVNPAFYSGIGNMDTGDAAGDAFFALRSVYMPVECNSSAGHHFAGDCSNPEIEGRDLTVTEVVVEIDNRTAGYSECNVCVNSTVPFTKDQKCVDGQYVCVCGPFGHFSTDCPATVGKESPSSVFGRWPMRPGSPNFEWWLRNLVERVEGLWYSTPSSGECTPTSGTCYWRLVEKKRQVRKKCQDTYISKQISAANPDCFSACPQPTNMTSTCAIECFFDTLLGPNSGSQNTTGTGKGMTQEQIVNMWLFPVENDETKGGCPDYKPLGF